nr:MAG TPA: hypothetical protein [Caudoviricetes sp.]
MHDMHANTMHHAWDNACHKGNAQRTNAQTCKTIQKTKEML